MWKNIYIKPLWLSGLLFWKKNRLHSLIWKSGVSILFAFVASKPDCIYLKKILSHGCWHPTMQKKNCWFQDFWSNFFSLDPVHIFDLLRPQFQPHWSRDQLISTGYQILAKDVIFHIMSVQVILVVDTVVSYYCIYYEYYLNRR